MPTLAVSPGWRLAARRGAAWGCAFLLGTAAGWAGPRTNEAPSLPAPATRPLRLSRAAAEQAAPGGFTVDPSSREAVRIFYRTVYAASENAVIGWTGSVTQGAAGTTAPDFKDAVRRRINWFRAMAGIPAAVVFDDTFSSEDQQAALMMSANNALNHAPPTTWKDYTAAGAEAAGKSNLFLGCYGPQAVTGYMEDFGAGNEPVGHRRWLLYPQTKAMGTGDIPPDGVAQSASVIWVVTADYGTARPPVRDNFVAWPPPGYVPSSLVFPRWSLSCSGANFGTATVSMQRGGKPVPVSIQARGSAAGEDSIVWVWDGLDANAPQGPGPPPAADTPVQVAVNGVKINGQTQNFSYTVNLFDPQQAGADSVLATPSGPAQPVVDAANAYGCNTLPLASGYQWRSAQLSPLTAVEGAENGAANVTLSLSGGSTGISTSYHAGGAQSFHLATPLFDQQSVTLHTVAYVQPATQLVFKSRFGLASPDQKAHAQVSTDDGASWDTLFTEAGSDNAASGFTTHTLPLGQYANRSVQVRFLFAYEGTGAAYTQTAENFGWYLDDVSFTNASELTGTSLGPVSPQAAFAFTPPAAGAYALQARGQFFGDYLYEWGPVLLVTATGASPPQIVVQPAALTSVTADDPALLAVTASGPGTLQYQWFHGAQPIPGANATSLSLASVQPSDAGAYHVEVSNDAGTTPSDTVTLAVAIPDPVVTTLAGSPASETAVQLAGHAEIHGQMVLCGFEYGLDAGLGTSVTAGSAAQSQDFQAAISSIANHAVIFYRAFAQTAGAVRFYGATQMAAPLQAPAALTVSVSPPGSGTVSGVPVGIVRVGDAISLTAAAGAGQAFAGWTGDESSAPAVLAFAMPAAATVVANFVPNPVPAGLGNYRGLALTAPAAHATCGLLTVAVAARGAFTGQAIIGGVRFALHGLFDGQGVAQFGKSPVAMLPRAGQSPLFLQMHFPLAPGAPQRLVGSVGAALGPAAVIDAPRVLFTAGKNPLPPMVNPPGALVGPFTASYTVDAATSVAGLTGRGWTTATVGKDGVAHFTGALADGTSCPWVQPLAIDGTVPLFALLYGGKGSVLGAVQFSGSPATLSGTAVWFRPPDQAGPRFKGGWPDGVKLDVDGGPWAGFKPNATWPLPKLATTGGGAQLIAAGGGLAADLSWTAAFSLKSGRVTISATPGGATATLTVAPATGAFSGAFRANPKSPAVAMHGVLITGKNEAHGFFLDATGSGPISLLPQ